MFLSGVIFHTQPSLQPSSSFSSPAVFLTKYTDVIYQCILPNGASIQAVVSNTLASADNLL